MLQREVVPAGRLLPMLEPDLAPPGPSLSTTHAGLDVDAKSSRSTSDIGHKIEVAMMALDGVQLSETTIVDRRAQAIDPCIKNTEPDEDHRLQAILVAPVIPMLAPTVTMLAESHRERLDLVEDLEIRATSKAHLVLRAQYVATRKTRFPLPPTGLPDGTWYM